MVSIFTQIIQGELPCHKLLENNEFLAFLDIRPIQTGHCLVIPKVEVDKIFDLPDTLLGTMLPFAKSVANAIEKAVPCKRVGIMVAGLEVPHAHLHLVPISHINDLSFALAHSEDEDTLAQLAERIKHYL